MEDIKKVFGSRIKKLREARGLNQEQLAEMIDFESRHLSRIETGKSFTTIENLEKIAGALNVDINMLFDFRHEQNTNVLLKEINDMLADADDEKIKLIYKIIVSVMY